MDFTNINDPAGVKALLEQLRSSQAWKAVGSDGQPTETTLTRSENDGHLAATNHTSETTRTAGTVTTQEVQEATTNSDDTTQNPPSGSSVADLLSQLQSSASWKTSEALRHPPVRLPQIPQHAMQPPQPAIPHLDSHSVSTPPLNRKQDTRRYTFQQALPYLTQLADNSEFISSINRLREEQNALERQLMEERKSIINKHEEKVKVAKTKANMIGAGLSKHEADMMTQAFHRELQKFGDERALLAWDGLATKQQAALEGLSVPTMFVTDSKADREKQQRVVQVLEGIVGADG